MVSLLKKLNQLETVKGHHSVPRGNKVLNEFLSSVGISANLCNRA
jgi:hypothetical protein